MNTSRTTTSTPVRRRSRPSELIAPRDRELRRIVLQIWREHPSMGWLAAWKQAVEQPASRWWISEERAAQAIGAWLKRPAGAPPPQSARQRLYADLTALYRERRAAEPDLSISQFCADTVSLPAPCHYVEPDTARRSAARTHRNDQSNENQNTPCKRRRNAMRRPRHYRAH